MNELPNKELRRLIDYNPDTGEMKWKVRISNRFRAGSPALASVKNSGHLHGLIHRKPFHAHRVAWAIHYGEWPSGFIDHINGVRDDNRISNLRIVTRRGNAMNRRPNSGKSSGLPHGVSVRANGRYFAQIQHNGKNHHLGYFDSPEAAESAYVKAKHEMGFHENHGLKALIAAEDN